jgi:hypothetical protein
VSTCFAYLLFPNPTEIANNTETLKNKVLTKFPIGYITRLYTILSSTGTTTIPVLSYTWANDGGPFSGKTLSFDVDSIMVQAKGLTNEMTSNTDHKTVWDIFMPFVNLFLALFLIYSMVGDIMGIDFHTGGRKGGFSDKGSLGDNSSKDDSYKLKEYLYQHRKQ